MDRNITVLAVLLMYSVALRKESVDRNILLAVPCRILRGRSPQGERG